MQKLIDLNKQFYNNIADEFSVSRQYAWKGWGRVVDEIMKLENKNIKILDLGCGNGRFLKFLQNSLNDPFKYIGVDTNEKLLKIAHNDLNEKVDAHFFNMDVINEINKINDVYNVICAFGLIHHIPSYNFRLKWFEQVLPIIDESGLFVFTLWNTDNYRFIPANASTVAKKIGINMSELENGDIFLGWNGNYENLRYVHQFSPDEIKDINNLLEKNKTRLEASFINDGRENNLNTYFIYRKY